MAANGEAPDGPPAELLRAAVRSIGDHALAMNLGRAARLADLLARAENGRLVEGHRTAAIELAHQLVGSAGTFGFPQASALAAELEQFFTDAAFDDRERLARARGQLEELREALAAEPAYQPDDE
jgi:HPt (histidine-containing phosphotransfer) domain-containing protein